jgi:hypothetical protein
MRPISTGNESCVLFVTADYGRYVRIAEPIEDFVDLRPWNTEDVRHALSFQCLNNHISSGCYLRLRVSFSD